MANVTDQLESFLRKQPTLGQDVYIARGAIVIGDVRIGGGSSIWYNSVVRGDINYIAIGRFSNIQDNTVVHLADDYPCVIGDWVTVGHGAIIHACEVKNGCLIGMGATILDGAVIGEESLVGANSLVTQGTEIPPGSLVLGSPAKVVRSLTESERRDLKPWAEKYVRNAAYCLKHQIGVGGVLVS